MVSSLDINDCYEPDILFCFFFSFFKNALFPAIKRDLSVSAIIVHKGKIWISAQCVWQNYFPSIVGKIAIVNCFRKCGYIHPEIKKIPGIVGGIDQRMSLLQHFVFETMRHQGHNDNIYFQHYLQNHIIAQCNQLYLALAALNRLNHVMFNKERISNINQFEAEQGWAYRCIETCFDKFDSLFWKAKRRDVNFNYSLFNKQGKQTADKRELQFVHAMFPSAY